MAQSNSVFSKSKSKTSLLFLVLILAFNFSCSSKKTDGGEPAPDPEAGFLRIKPEIKRFNESLKNSDTAQRAPYVVMVSLDGFRHDYEKMYGAKTLEAIAKNGVQAAGLIPIYPSKTFPNHYSIVTGLYAD
ncbi:MAG: alkaline phosphatase family protein, partial [Pseudobdellovibrionaceae bacterium]